MKCAHCGRFIANKQMIRGGGARCEYEPDSHFGPERIEWLCAKCAADGSQPWRNRSKAGENSMIGRER
jgi:hypothetical protein